jgi:thiamine pyrophosphokinase
MKALIVGSGSLYEADFLKEKYKWADLVIAADGGALHLDNAGLVPHVLMGDFDSLPGPVLEKLRRNENVEIIKFRPEKDFTDTELAIDIALERGADEISLVGACGTRLDHTVANIHLLYKILKSGAKGCIEDENNQVLLIDDSITLYRRENYKVSLVPLPPFVKGITTTGLLYPLDDDTFAFGIGRGISNEFEDEKATVSIKEGLLLVFVSKD